MRKGRGRGSHVGAEDAGKYRASLAISRKALIPRQEGRIVLLSELDVEKKNLEFSVNKERQRDRKRKTGRERERERESNRQRMKEGGKK